MLKVESPLLIGTGPAVAPITIPSTVLCPGLNAEYVGGYTQSQLAKTGHGHTAAEVTTGVFTGFRLGSDYSNGFKALFAGSSVEDPPRWKYIDTSDVQGISSYMRDSVLPADATGVLFALGAAPASHGHFASEITSGVFKVARLGSGDTTSLNKVLFGSSSGGTGQWRSLVVADVSGAVGFSGSPTTGRIPYWTAPGTLGNSPFNCVGDPVSSVTTDANFGTNGSVTCNDLVVNYAAAVNFKSSIYTKVKSIVTGSASVTVTPNDGAQTLTLTSTGGGGVTPPTSNAGDVYVWVVDSPAGSGQWLKLVGSEQIP